MEVYVIICKSLCVNLTPPHRIFLVKIHLSLLWFSLLMMGCKSMGKEGDSSYQSPSELKAVYGGDYILTLEQQSADQGKLIFQMCTITEFWPDDSSSPKNCMPAFVDSNLRPVSLTINDLSSIALSAEEREVLKRFEASIDEYIYEIENESLLGQARGLVSAAVDPYPLFSFWAGFYAFGLIMGISEFIAHGTQRMAALPMKIHAIVFGTGMAAVGIVEVQKMLAIQDSQKVQLLKEAGDKPVSASYKELALLEQEWKALTTMDPEFVEYVNNIFEITNSLGLFLKQRLQGLPAGRITHYCFPTQDYLKRTCKILKSDDGA